MTWSRSVRWCLTVGLACGDQRWLTGNGSALEVLHDDALYKSTTLLFLLAYMYIIVNFQLRSSIHAGLMERSLYNRFCIEKSAKIGFLGDFWGVAKIIGGNLPLGMQWPPIYVVWWKNYRDALNTLVCTVYTRQRNYKKRNVYAVMVTFHPCAVLTPLNP